MTQSDADHSSRGCCPVCDAPPLRIADRLDSGSNGSGQDHSGQNETGSPVIQICPHCGWPQAIAVDRGVITEADRNQQEAARQTWARTLWQTLQEQNNQREQLAYLSEGMTWLIEQMQDLAASQLTERLERLESQILSSVPCRWVTSVIHGQSRWIVLEDVTLEVLRSVDYKISLCAHFQLNGRQNLAG